MLQGEGHVLEKGARGKAIQIGNRCCVIVCDGTSHFRVVEFVQKDGVVVYYTKRCKQDGCHDFVPVGELPMKAQSILCMASYVPDQKGAFLQKHSPVLFEAGSLMPKGAKLVGSRPVLGKRRHKETGTKVCIITYKDMAFQLKSSIVMG